MRLLWVTLSFFLTLAALVALGDLVDERGLYLRGRESDALHRGFDRERRTVEKEKPDVLVFGDSTLMETVPHRAWPEIAGEELERDGTSLYAFRGLGLDFFQYYCLFASLEAANPKEALFVAHLRLFRTPDERDRMVDLCSDLPFAELPRALTLPFPERDTGPLRLLGLQTLRFGPVRDAAILIEGVKRSGQLADPTGLAPKAHRWLTRMVQDAETMNEEERLAEYDVRLREDSAAVQMMAATLRLARERGIETLVLISPIPVTRLAARGIYHPESIDVLRTVARENGARVIDLHDALPPRGFRDASGHLSATGHGLVAGAVTAEISKLRRESTERDSLRSSTSAPP